MKKSMWMTFTLKGIKISLPISIGLPIAVILILAMLPLASQAAPLKRPSWRAEYYSNPSLSGQPSLVRWEDGFGHDWDFGSPAMEIPRDRFSARWTNTLEFEKGTYMFILSVDDGARVWLDGNLIIDAWNIGRKSEVKAKVRLDKTGNHQIQLACCKNTLKSFNNTSHNLYTGMVFMINNSLIRSTLTKTKIVFKKNKFIDVNKYVERNFNQISSAVGCYNVEGKGKTFFKNIMSE